MLYKKLSSVKADRPDKTNAAATLASGAMPLVTQFGVVDPDSVTAGSPLTSGVLLPVVVEGTTEDAVAADAALASGVLLQVAVIGAPLGDDEVEAEAALASGVLLQVAVLGGDYEDACGATANLLSGALTPI